jgi:hypothetical protein
MEIVMQRQTILRLAAIVALAGLAACSGGSTPSPAQQNPGSGGGIPAQTSAMKTITFNGTAQSVTLPVAGRVATATMMLPATSMAQPTQLTLVGSATDPTAGRLSSQVLRTKMSSVGLIEVLYYLVITPDVGISFTTIPGFTLTLPSSVSVPTTTTGQFYYGISTSPVNLGPATPNPYSTATPNPYSTYSPVSYTLLTEGPATVNSAGTYTFDEAPNPLTLLAGDSYIWVFYLNCTLSPGATSC